MRKDVKAGLVLALAVVVVAGWYYSGQKDNESAVPLAQRGAQSTTDAKTSPSGQKKPQRTGRKGSSRNANRNASSRSASNRDRVASSKDTGNDSRRENQVPNRTASRPGAKRDGAASSKLLNDVSSTLADIGKPKAQASPPSSGKGLATKGAGDGKERIASGKQPPRANPTDRTSGGTGNTRTALSNAEKKDQVKGNMPVAGKKSKDAKIKKGLPNMEGSERYVIQPGDSFMLLAEVYYGSQSHAGFLMRANPHVKDPKRLRVGTEIQIPTLPSKSAKRQQTGLLVNAKKSGKTYKVQPGDSLTGIAEEVLGSTAKWKELYELNKDMINNPDVLRAGVVLVLPE